MMVRKLSTATPALTPELALAIIIRERRKELGLLQADLEGDADMDRSYISKLERGLQQPRLRAIIHLEKVLRFQPGELLKKVRELTE